LQKKGRGIADFASANPIFVDSSGWIALFSARDQNHADADRLFREAISLKRLLLTSNLIIAEVHRLLLHRAGERAALSALAHIEASPCVKILFEGSEQHQAAIAWLKRLSGVSVSYADSVSFVIMESEGCKDFICYDQHLLTAGFNVLS
jgi:predicted nucleic acid-binding protein